MEVSLFQRFLSYFYPLKIEDKSNDLHQNLSLQIYQNQWQLEYGKALYSKGDSYRPFDFAFRKLKEELPAKKKFLLLGSGLGSALYILQKHYKLFPDAVLVDHDPDILNWSRELFSLDQRKNVRFRCQDIFEYLEMDQVLFDLIGIDVFHEMKIPERILHPEFWDRIRHISEKNTCIIWNADRKSVV